MRTLATLAAASLVWVLGFTTVHAADNPALWKHHVKGDYAKVLQGVKAGLEEKQFQILGEENLSRGLENNRQVFGEEKWNTIGFQNVTAVHFCSLTFNQQVFNMSMDWAILCPFKVVVFNMKTNPDNVTIMTTRPTWLLARDNHRKAAEVARNIESRITAAIKEGAAP